MAFQRWFAALRAGGLLTVGELQEPLVVPHVVGDLARILGGPHVLRNCLPRYSGGMAKKAQEGESAWLYQRITDEPTPFLKKLDPKDFLTLSVALASLLVSLFTLSANRLNSKTQFYEAKLRLRDRQAADLVRAGKLLGEHQWDFKRYCEAVELHPRTLDQSFKLSVQRAFNANFAMYRFLKEPNLQITSSIKQQLVDINSLASRVIGYSLDSKDPLFVSDIKLPSAPNLQTEGSKLQTQIAHVLSDISKSLSLPDLE